LKAYELQGPGGVDAMMLVEKPVPAPGPGQVLVKLKAVTINYRDLLTVKGGYGSRQKFPLVPLSDGAGVVESVGAGVTSFKAGDRVTGSFFEGWLGGGTTVGSVEDLQAMADAIAVNRMKPVVDKVFPFSEAKAAFAHMANGAHFGKVAIAIP
jgi:NADPH:quinone reductase-like Zn-dependent oxidoreductase